MLKKYKFVIYSNNMVTDKLMGWVLIGLTAASLMGCPTECLEPAYRFSAQMSIRPQTEVVAVGDTVWLESVTPVRMFDLSTKKEVDFSRAVNFGFGIRVAELSPASDTLIDAVNRFSPFVIAGSLRPGTGVPSARAIGLKYQQVQDEYRLRVGLICRQKGIFALFVSSATNVYQSGKTVCEGASIQITIDNSDKHLNYLQDLYFKTQPIEEAAKQTSYCFVVQ